MTSALLNRLLVSSAFSNTFKYNQVAKNVRIHNLAPDKKETFEFIKVSTTGEKQNIGLVQLDKPKVNVICNDLLVEIGQALNSFDNNRSVGAMILTGNGKLFSAGADLKKMSHYSFSGCMTTDFVGLYRKIVTTRKPLLAAVNGFAFGASLTLAMMCDIIYAGDKTKFALPELNYGIVTGAGGVQRITRSTGKYKAAEIFFSGDRFTSEEAERIGLISKIFPEDQVFNETLKLAEQIASNSQITNIIAKECVNAALETTLEEGLRFEKKMFYTCFSTKDQKEGMAAFVGKRKPNFTNQ